MIPLARRFSIVTAALLALAAIPIWIHRATGTVHDVCADPSALTDLPALGEAPDVIDGVPVEGGTFDLVVAGERPPLPGTETPIRFWLVRDARPYRFFGAPDNYFLTLPYPGNRTETRALQVGADVLTLHRRYGEWPDHIRFSQYVLVQGVTPIRHPLTAGFSNAIPQLLQGTQPIAMLLIQGVVPPKDVPAVEKLSDEWMAQAWTGYREVCRL